MCVDGTAAFGATFACLDSTAHITDETDNLWFVRSFGRSFNKLFTLRESRRGGHEPCEHGSDRRETSATRVSDDLEFLIF